MTTDTAHRAAKAAQDAIIAALGGQPFDVRESLWQSLRLAYLAEEMAFREESLVSWRSAEDAARGAA